MVYEDNADEEDEVDWGGRPFSFVRRKPGDKRKREGGSSSPSLPPLFQNVSDNSSKSFKPIRQYYASRTLLPHSSLSVDSDDDGDPVGTLRTVANDMLEEFTDVSATEKVFMKRWNVFAENDVVVNDMDVKHLVKRFAVKHLKWIREEKGMREEFVKHCLNLWDNAVLAGKDIEELMGVV
eukprot:CAMPEP_0118637468 /NCGR_PEP_ID=MMETSP0785-20121206/3166_1 /TAXON_ID=91992 /ORGANISM="Bolidomonas pacifica, Strain CCMP 1866" /LENGTH=179 /DNA_ID=CAMNT_0006528651 /DNA_START=655 /DNA_END=1191 /DNA_ORIENTATION=+